MHSNCLRPVSYFSPSEFPPACTVGMREGWQGVATIADGFLEGKHSLFTEMADAVICPQLFSLSLFINVRPLRRMHVTYLFAVTLSHPLYEFQDIAEKEAT